MHGYADDACVNSVDAITGLLALLILDILVPKWVS